MVRSTITTCALLAVLAFASVQALSRAVALQPNLAADTSQTREMLYMPSGKGLHVLSFGYHNTLAHFLWFNTISYFGKHHKSDQNYRWLSHMCTLVSDLNPRAKHVYDFCSTMLAWEANRPEDSIALLTKALRQEPENWFLYYQRGFVHMFFLRDSEKAQEDFLKASTLPNAHPLVKRLAAKKLAASDNARAAVEFLSDMLKNERDPSAREALEGRLREARYEFDLQMIEKARDRYREKFQRFPLSLDDLATEGLLVRDFRDPFGGTYRLDPLTGAVTSTSGHRRLVLYQGKE